MQKYRLEKRERLTRKKVIEKLFQQGRSFQAFPLRILFTTAIPAGSPTQVLVSVPARIFPKATDRNTLKRRIREGYRLNKGLLNASSRFSLAYIYTAREVLPSPAIHQAIRSSLERLNRYDKED